MNSYPILSKRPEKTSSSIREVVVHFLTDFSINTNGCQEGSSRGERLLALILLKGKYSNKATENCFNNNCDKFVEKIEKKIIV